MKRRIFRRIGALLLSLALCLALLPMGIWAAEPNAVQSTADVEGENIPTSGTCGENLTWNLDLETGTLTISGTGEMEDYDSQDSVPWYNFHNNLKKVDIGEGITSIGSYAFYFCGNLGDISIPDSITSIGSYAFYSCDHLTSLVIPDSVNSIGSGAFRGCFRLTNITIPPNITEIPKEVFLGCNGLTNITIPDGVSSIGGAAFSGCYGLTSITIPDSVNSIGSSAFSGCSGLTNIEIPDSVTSIGYLAFSGCSGLTNIAIPDGVPSIGSSTFQGCTSLTNITIPDSVTSIKDSAFSDCRSLSNIVIPDSVTRIEEYAFYMCNSLERITIPDSVTYISSKAFSSCTSLADISVNTNNLSYASNDGVLFDKNHTKLIQYPAGKMDFTYSVPDSIISIEDWAFSGCSNLNSITIPKSVNSIGSSVFYNCDNLEDIYYAGSKGEWDAISGIEDIDSTNITIHYTGPDSGTTTPDSRTTSIKYLTGWNEDTQTADFMSDSSYSACDETDLSFVQNIETLLNRYVLVESKVDDSLKQLLSITPVDSALGTCTSHTETEITIDGTVYAWTSGYSSEISAPVLYHTLNGELVGVDYLQKETSTDLHWDEANNRLSSYMRSYPINYMTDMETVEKYKEYCDTHSYVETTVYYAELGSYRPLMRVYGSAHFYGVPSESEEETPKDIINDYWLEWYDAYDGYISAISKALVGAQNQETDRAASIEAQAEAMMASDNKTHDKLLTFEAGFPTEWKIYAYQALCSTLLDASEQHPDFSSISLKDEVTVSTAIVREIAQNMSTCKETYKIDDIVIDIGYGSFLGARAGTMTCRESAGSKSWIVVICSSQSDCKRLVADYLNQLKELEYKALNNVYSGIAKDLLGQPISKLTEAYIRPLVAKYEATLDKLHLGKVHEVLVRCNSYYSEYKNLYSKLNEVKLEDLDGILNCLSISDDTVTDKVTKKAVQILEKAQTKLNTALTEYATTGSITPPKKGFLDMLVSIFKCPVSIAVYNGDRQIGYVGDDDVWYDDSIYIEERGDAKIIYSPQTSNISFVITGTDDGVMSYTVEEYVDGNPTGRLNFNNISVRNGQQFTAQLENGPLAENQSQFVLKSNGNEIKASEYIAASDVATVLIHASASSSEQGTVWGDGSYARGDAVILYAIPENNYIFMGWYDTAGALVSVFDVYEFSAQEDTTLTAFFAEHVDSDEEKPYTIIFDPNGGTVDTSSMETAPNGVLADLPIPIYEGYSFGGWYTERDGGTKISVSTVFTQSITLYAHWTRNDDDDVSSDDSGHSNEYTDGKDNRPSYSISAPSSLPGGTIKVTPSYANKGNTVTITVNSKNGYKLEELIVTDTHGNELKLTKKSDTKYIFTMPNSKVIVDASFMECNISDTALPFDDIISGSWYEDAVRYVYENGLMTGTSGSTFSPDATTTRGQIVTILWRLEDSPVVNYLMDFADVEPEAYYGEAVRWAASEGIVGGYGNGNFGPNDAITREQLAVILYRYAQYEGYDVSGSADLSGYTDRDAISGYALEAMNWGNDASIINGTSDNTLSPQGQTTRAQVAAMLTRFCEWYVEK